MSAATLKYAQHCVVVPLLPVFELVTSVCDASWAMSGAESVGEAEAEGPAVGDCWIGWSVCRAFRLGFIVCVFFVFACPSLLDRHGARRALRAKKVRPH